MSKEKELVKNTAIITFGKICTLLISFFLLPLYTAILSTEEYGTVDLVMTYSSLLLPIVTLSLEQGLFRYLIDVRSDEERKSSVITTSLLFAILQSIVFCGILCVIQIFIKSSLLYYFMAIVVASVFSETGLQLCRGLGDNIGYTLGSAITAVVMVCCNVLFLAVLNLGAPGMMLASFFGNAACTIIISFRCRISRYIKIEYFRVSVLKRLLRYSIPLVPNQLSWWALHASDKVIVHFFIGVAGNGLIAVANKFSSVYMRFSNIFNVSWTESSVMHIDDDDAEEFFTKTINTSYELFLCACCGIIVCMPFAFPILVNSSYSEAYGLIPIFMLASHFNVVVSLYGVIYVAHKKTTEIAKTSFYAAVINIASHLILINFIGIYAAPTSTLIGFGCMAVYRYFHSRRYIVVKIYPQYIFLSFLIIFVSLFAYYSSFKIIQVIALIFVVTVSVYLNLNFVLQLWGIIKNRLGVSA